MAAIGLLILGLALLVSILFNLLQLKWRNEERAARGEDNAEQKRKDDEREAAQRLKEQAAPSFFQLRRDSRPDTGHRESAFVARAIHVLMGSRDRRESYSVAYEDHPAPAPHGRRGMACSEYFLPLEI